MGSKSASSLGAPSTSAQLWLPVSVLQLQVRKPSPEKLPSQDCQACLPPPRQPRVRRQGQMPLTVRWHLGRACRFEAPWHPGASTCRLHAPALRMGTTARVPQGSQPSPPCFWADSEVWATASKEQQGAWDPMPGGSHTGRAPSWPQSWWLWPSCWETGVPILPQPPTPACHWASSRNSGPTC